MLTDFGWVQRPIAISKRYTSAFALDGRNGSTMNPCVLCALLATLVVGIQVDETDHQKKIPKIETEIDQLIYRIIKLENGIDARRAPDKVRGYKNLSHRVSKVEGMVIYQMCIECDIVPRMITNFEVLLTRTILILYQAICTQRTPKGPK